MTHEPATSVLSADDLKRSVVAYNEIVEMRAKAFDDRREADDRWKKHDASFEHVRLTLAKHTRYRQKPEVVVVDGRTFVVPVPESQWMSDLLRGVDVVEVEVTK